MVHSLNNLYHTKVYKAQLHVWYTNNQILPPLCIPYSVHAKSYWNQRRSIFNNRNHAAPMHATDAVCVDPGRWPRAWIWTLSSIDQHHGIVLCTVVLNSSIKTGSTFTKLECLSLYICLRVMLCVKCHIPVKWS